VTPRRLVFKLREDRPPFDLAAALRDLTSAPDVAQQSRPLSLRSTLRTAQGRAGAISETCEQGDFVAAPPRRPSSKSVTLMLARRPSRRMLSTIGASSARRRDSANRSDFDANLSTGVRNYQARHWAWHRWPAWARRPSRAEAPPRGGSGRSRSPRALALLSRLRTPPIIVNIPQFRLFAFRTTRDRAADILQMDVSSDAPIRKPRLRFEGDMRYSSAPYWMLP